MLDDIAAIRATVTTLVENGQVVLLVLHSAGGFLGSNAIEGLSVGARQEAKLQGGVGKIVFLTGAVFPEGFRHAPLPFFTYEVRCGFLFCFLRSSPNQFVPEDLGDAKMPNRAVRCIV